MEENYAVPAVIPIPPRFCSNSGCSKRLAALNRGKYCYTCEAQVSARRAAQADLAALRKPVLPNKPPQPARMERQLFGTRQPLFSADSKGLFLLPRKVRLP